MHYLDCNDESEKIKDFQSKKTQLLYPLEGVKAQARPQEDMLINEILEDILGDLLKKISKMLRYILIL
jgi:hypothetical protein